MCCCTYEVKLFTCTFLLAYFALLRVGEFTLVNSNTQNSSNCIQLKPIQGHPHKHYLRLTIQHSKTDQVGKNTTFIIHSQPLATLCPNKATLDFIECTPHTPVNHGFLIHLNTKPLMRGTNSTQSFKRLLKTYYQHQAILAHTPFKLGGQQTLHYRACPIPKFRSLVDGNQ